MPRIDAGAMKPILGAVFVTSLFAASALAQTLPVPLPLGPNSGPLVAIPLGPGLQASGGGPPPPTCSNALDFSQACNSQYINVVGL